MYENIISANASKNKPDWPLIDHWLTNTGRNGEVQVTNV